MSLKYISAYLMAVTAGNERPSASDVESILASVGADVDEAILNKLISEMRDKTPHQVIAAGMTKLQSVPAGSAITSGGAAALGSTVAAGEASDAAKEQTKEEEPEEEEEDMGFSLFD